MVVPMVGSRSGTWLAVYDARVGRHAGVRAVDVTALSPDLIPTLAASLAVFQLGESGTGEHLLAAAERSGADAGYVAELARFVAEEQEHARLLAVILQACDWPLRTRHWSDQVFVLIRRAHSLRTEVLVLLVAEVIALSYYSAVRDGIGTPSLRDVFDRIHADEVVHVEFHCQTFPLYLSRLSRPTHAAAHVIWNVLVVGASIVVAYDHGKLLRQMGLTRRAFAKRVWRDRAIVATRLFATATRRSDRSSTCRSVRNPAESWKRSVGQ
jgi:hypothetical protein